jgi:UDP-N-acetylmuramate: L-alanyl-gamma-D-glutamyl-meso-diaminopimelate ligase
VHYRPRTLVLNNLEYDHADIYSDLDAILWQFHQLLRTVPAAGRIVVNEADENLKRLLEMGCWTPVEKFSVGDNADWTAHFDDAVGRRISVQGPGGRTGSGRWPMSGLHNLENALAAVAAAASAGVSLERAVDALSRFEGVKRRMERTATVADIAIYDDFAHHPTAIKKSIEALRQQHPGHRVIVAVEPRSNTMKLGVHNDELAASLQGADLVWMFRPVDMGDGFDAALASLGEKLRLFSDYDQLVNDLSTKVSSGDRVVFMSNGGFGAARQTLTALLQRTRGS